MSYCGLLQENAVCFHHQIKRCNGICAGEEDIDSYNKRAASLIKKHSYTDPHFAIITAGRSQGEKAMIVVLNNKFAGTGYFDEYTQLNSLDDFMDVINKADYYPDNDVLIRSWIKSNQPKLLSLKPLLR
ncbi:MAG: hypothetical protein ACK5QU_00010 [Bacteroidota bacterium]